MCIADTGAESRADGVAKSADSSLSYSFLWSFRCITSRSFFLDPSARPARNLLVAIQVEEIGGPLIGTRVFLASSSRTCSLLSFALRLRGLGSSHRATREVPARMTNHRVKYQGLDFFHQHPVVCTWLLGQIEMSRHVATFAKKH